MLEALSNVDQPADELARHIIRSQKKDAEKRHRDDHDDSRRANILPRGPAHLVHLDAYFVQELPQPSGMLAQFLNRAGTASLTTAANSLIFHLYRFCHEFGPYFSTAAPPFR